MDTRPDDASYDAHVLGFAQALTSGATVFVRLRARSTAYDLVVVRGDVPTRLDDSQDERFNRDYILVAAPEHGAYFFAVDGYAHPSYVADKLGYTAGGDGEV